MPHDKQVLFWLAALILFALAVLVLKDVLLPFVAGLVLAYALNPLTEWLVRAQLPRTIASAVVVLGVVLTFVLITVFLLPLLLDQLSQMLQSLPRQAERLADVVEGMAKDRLGPRFASFVGKLERALSELSVGWTSIVGTLASSAWTQGMAIVNIISLMLITPVVVFYLLVDWHPMLKKIDSWMPVAQAPTIRRLAGEIDQAVSSFIRGQGLVCLILGVIYAGGLSLAGLSYGLLIGIATGIASFVPFAGWILGLIVSVLVALVQSWPDMALLYKVLGVFAFAVALDAALLSPTIVGSRVGLHPVWLIFSLFVFSYLFGFVGVLVAVPLGAAIAVLVRFALQVYLASEFYRGPAADGRAGGGGAQGS
ncbi:MAG: AI-2E family transporter [Hyphomicrobiaceae bacterium]